MTVNLAAAIIVWLLAAALAWAFVDDVICAYRSGSATPLSTSARRIAGAFMLLIVGLYALLGHTALNPAVGWGFITAAALIW